MSSNVPAMPETAAVPAGLFAQVQQVSRIPLRQMFVLMVGFAAAIAVGVGVWLWSATPDYRVLYSNLSDRDGGAVVASLSQLNVPYKIAD
ncbi:MAG TPA: flagellar basal body M-ring protein FliF, partial [Casimicrobiaceae bacterium]|nr:flagellar basal body M-ring protein FliF [Casimicrobiaceae bacterium]